MTNDLFIISPYLNQRICIHEAKFKHFPSQDPHNAVELISTLDCHDSAEKCMHLFKILIVPLNSELVYIQ
jgi:hypothetical protein